MSRFGELEAAVMDRLWAADAPTSVRQVVTDLQEQRALAYTTVMTVMERLYRKGLLSRVEHGRAYLYQPVQSRAAYTAGVMAEALDASTDRAATLVHFVDKVTPQEAKQLLAALSEKPRRRR